MFYQAIECSPACMVCIQDNLIRSILLFLHNLGRHVHSGQPNRFQNTRPQINAECLGPLLQTMVPMLENNAQEDRSRQILLWLRSKRVSCRNKEKRVSNQNTYFKTLISESCTPVRKIMTRKSEALIISYCRPLSICFQVWNG